MVLLDSLLTAASTLAALPQTSTNGINFVVVPIPPLKTKEPRREINLET